MAFDSRIITIFVSSPGDVFADRRIVLEEIQTWNQRNARDRGCFLTALTWEDLVSPDIGKSAQDVINVEVGDDYDVFLGLMWSRFGTPTGKAESGTQEEFERALHRKRSGEAIRISFFFRKSDTPLDDIDIEQLDKVREFQKSLAKSGAFYGTYSDEREMSKELVKLFDRISSEKDRYFTTDEPSPGSPEGGRTLVETAANFEKDLSSSDPGLFDLEEDLNQNAQLFGDALGEWTAEFDRINSIVREATSELSSLSQFGKPDRDAVRAVVDKTTAGLAAFAEFGRKRVVDIEDHLDGMTLAMDGIVIVSKDFKQDPNDLEELIGNIGQLRQQADLSKTQTEQYINTMIDLPRIDKKFNRARDSVVSVHEQLCRKIGQFSEKLSVISDDLKDLSRT